MKAIFLMLLLLTAISSNVSASEIRYTIAYNVSPTDRKTLSLVMHEVSLLLPETMKKGLPGNIEIKVEQLTPHKEIPDNVCSVSNADKKDQIKNRFVYGEYDKIKDRLTLNAAVLLELRNGRTASKMIDCQHKNLYDQALATIVHELTHAYDFNNNMISSSPEYLKVSNFKAGLFSFLKAKNSKAMRSADPYELKNVEESFAVNMEYFVMDPEFSCRKPSMYNYLKNLFAVKTFPHKNCQTGNTVMLSSPSGYIPVKLDPERVYRIDYLMASPGEEMSSGFGHSMLRIIMCAPEHYDPLTKTKIPATPYGKKCLEDKLFHLVVSYRANIEDATLNYVKGLFGGYPSMLFILSFSDVLDEYNKDELRNVESYPIKLDNQEKTVLIQKIIEEHWNYKGSYKFISNNCAVETYDLLSSAFGGAEFDQQSSVTPRGVLEDLENLKLVTIKDAEIERFVEKTGPLVLAYKMAYGFQSKNKPAKDKKKLQKFMFESSIEFRNEKFNEFTKVEIGNGDLRKELISLKEHLVVASSFSILEQQILRSLGMQYRKKAADLITNVIEDEKTKQKLHDIVSNLITPFSNLSKVGYGIPFEEEMISLKELSGMYDKSFKAIADGEALLKEVMADEMAELEKIGKNIIEFNRYSISVRKKFRERLEMYIHQEIVKLSGNAQTREVLSAAVANGDATNLLKVRELMGRGLVTKEEITDGKLKKLIGEVL